MKKSLLVLAIISSLFVSSAFAMDSPMDWEREAIDALFAQARPLNTLLYKDDIEFGVGEAFLGLNGKVVLECIEAPCEVATESYGRTFNIKIKEEVEETAIGIIKVLYRPQRYDVHIASIEISSPYQHRGYGTDALETILKIYRAESRNYLEFVKFTLTVFKGDKFKAARALYKKLNFKIATRR